MLLSIKEERGKKALKCGNAGQKRKVEDVIKKEAEATDEGGEPAGKKAKVAGEAHIKTEVKEEDKEE